MLGRALAPLIVAALCSAVLAAPTTPAAQAQPDPDRPARSVRAEAALTRVAGLLDQRDLDPRVAGSATMALRDLALLKDALPPAQRERAAAYLSRPTASPGRCPDFSCYTTKRVQRVCFATVCVHYVRRADDRKNGVPPRDTDRDGRPDFVEHVLRSVTRVHRAYVDAGYRPPARDGRRGGDARPDIYLAQIGNKGLYGYCTTDAARVPDHGSAPAYCVLDNDYARTEFPANTPIENMQVTAAHEYFHAVQFGYDVGEDPWFMEATATWVEDEVYDRVDDNVNYLRRGPMGRPGLSLDATQRGFYYGAWIFFRHLTERYGESQAGLPTIVRRMWRLADARGDAPDLYSMAAVERALTERGSSTQEQLLQMAAANLHPKRWYDEGGLYPPTRTTTWTLAPGEARGAGTSLNHLSSASYRVEPRRTGPRWLLEVDLDLGPVERGSAALVRVYFKSGGVRTTVPTLSPAGDFTGTFAFATGKVKAVEVTVANGSVRYLCNVGTGWSCKGRPLDQNVSQEVAFEPVRGPA